MNGCVLEQYNDRGYGQYQLSHDLQPLRIEHKYKCRRDKTTI